MKSLNALQGFVSAVACLLVILGYPLLGLFTFVLALGIYSLEQKNNHFSVFEAVVYTLNVMLLILYAEVNRKELSTEIALFVSHQKIFALVAVSCSVISNIIIKISNLKENK
jgi:hypothetical protein